MNEEYERYCILFGSIILIVIVVIIVYVNRPNFVENSITKASKETNFEPTFFEIYDKSTTDVCDRLIFVKPFNWLIWAKNGVVYVLNDSIYDCPQTTTPAVRVPSAVNNNERSIYNFKTICINIVLSDILATYRSCTPSVVKFDITALQQTKDRFTILDALNYLFQNYITMDSPLALKTQNQVFSNKSELLHSNITEDERIAFDRFSKSEDFDSISVSTFLDDETMQNDESYTKPIESDEFYSYDSPILNSTFQKRIFSHSELLQLYTHAQKARESIP